MSQEHKLFVRSLSWNTTDDSLWEAFKKYGEIPFCRVCTDRETGKSRGFGFVSFQDEAAAKKAIEEMDGVELDGRAINVQMSQPREAGAAGPKKDFGGEKRQPPKREGFELFVRGLSWDTTDDTLWEAFKKFGEVPFCRVCTERETGRSRGFGFVRYLVEAEANAALEAMNGANLDGREISVNHAGQKPDNNNAGSKRKWEETTETKTETEAEPEGEAKDENEEEAEEEAEEDDAEKEAENEDKDSEEEAEDEDNKGKEVETPKKTKKAKKAKVEKKSPAEKKKSKKRKVADSEDENKVADNKEKKTKKSKKEKKEKKEKKDGEKTKKVKKDKSEKKSKKSKDSKKAKKEKAVVA